MSYSDRRWLCTRLCPLSQWTGAASPKAVTASLRAAGSPTVTSYWPGRAQRVKCDSRWPPALMPPLTDTSPWASPMTRMRWGFFSQKSVGQVRKFVCRFTISCWNFFVTDQEFLPVEKHKRLSFQRKINWLKVGWWGKKSSRGKGDKLLK